MKKWMAIALCGVMLLGGCTAPNEPDNTEPSVTEPANDVVLEAAKNVFSGELAEYMVMKENTAYVYRGDTDEVASYTTYVEFAEGNRVQRRIVTASESIVEVLQFTDKSLDLVYTEVRYNRHENLLDREPNVMASIIGTPLKENVGWSYYDAMAGTEITFTVTDVDVEVTVPYGTFQTIEVTKVYADNNFEVKIYYAKDVGVVKTTNISENKTVSSELAEVHENVAYSSASPLFYMDNGVRVYDVYSIQYQTNTDIIELYNETLQAHFGEKFDIQASLLQIEKVDVEYTYATNPLVTVHFAKGLTAEALPAEAVRCLTDTLGYLYGISEIIFTADGEILWFENVAQTEEGVLMAEPIPDEAADRE